MKTTKQPTFHQSNVSKIGTSSKYQGAATYPGKLSFMVNQNNYFQTCKTEFNKLLIKRNY